MATSWREEKIRCPFFRGEDAKRHKIICEGLGDAKSMSWTFGNERQRILQMEVFCQNHYRFCELCRMIQQSKYDS